eukprot:TRINITY_DN9220_c0_g3_i2.p1 TRINITY_DN9220_c0_g3~~TRINITY_DN9220_c0_g3_i2.p1  ORF type:complete len:407 (+),score=87.38 TRINITY_DN9220_c0_g3_i2:50-1270(+)
MAFPQVPEKEPLPREKEKTQRTLPKVSKIENSTYDARKLASMEVLYSFQGTVWTKSTFWKSMGQLLLISFSTSVICAVLLRHPEKLDTGRFSKISGSLTVIVGMLLGFFLSSSVNRWFACTKGFLELFDAIRCLQMQLNALGVPKNRLHMCIRYCLVSAYSLHHDLVCQTLHHVERVEYKKQIWEKMLVTADQLPDSSEAYKKTGSLAKVYEDEMEVIFQIEDPAQTLWVWVTSLITRMSADGELPPMSTPTYGHLIVLAEKAYNGIREVRASVVVQPPFVYVQMMAMLVNINNIMNAMTFGMTFGVTLSLELKEGITAVSGHVLQDVLISFFLSAIGPFLYQALLEVAVCIAQPFGGGSEDTAGRINTARALEQVEKDLRDAELMSDRIVYWERPSFKQLHVAGR